MFEKFKLSNLPGLVKRYKVTAIILAVCLIILGAIMAVAPFFTGAIFLPWIVICLFGISGLVAIFRFIFPGKGNDRSGGLLAYGILISILVVGIILCGVFAPAFIVESQSYPGWVAVSIRIIIFLSIFYGIFSIVKYIFALCSIGQVPKKLRAITIVVTILGIALSVLMVIFPFFMYVVSVVVCGATIFVEGIAILVLDIKNWNKPIVAADVEKHEEE